MKNLKNKTFVSGDIAVIEITCYINNKYFYVIVDRDDLEKIVENASTIGVHIAPNTNYARYYCKKTRKVKFLHRLINDTPDNLIVDHLNHRGLDNRKKNLRNCTHYENAQNARKRSKDNKNKNPQYIDICNRWEEKTFRLSK